MSSGSQDSKQSPGILDGTSAIPARAIANAFTEALRRLDMEVWPKVGRMPTRSEMISFVENIRFEIYKKSKVIPPAPSKSPQQPSDVPTDSRAEWLSRRGRLPNT